MGKGFDPRRWTQRSSQATLEEPQRRLRVGSSDQAINMLQFQIIEDPMKDWQRHTMIVSLLINVVLAKSETKAQTPFPRFALSWLSRGVIKRQNATASLRGPGTPVSFLT